MSLSPQDAAAALQDIEAAQARSVMLRDYRHASPHLIAWGVLWVIGYGLNDLFPMHANAIWSVVVPVGLIADFAAMRGAPRGIAWRYLAAIAAALAVVLAMIFVIARQAESPRVRAFVSATEGTGGAHRSARETAGYVEMEKALVAKRPRSGVSLRRGGRRPFARHVAYLREILEGTAETEARS